MTMSRRYLLAAGAGVVAGGAAMAGATWIGRGPTHQQFLRRWYTAWEKADWPSIDSMMTDDFAFSSAAGDDHLSKETFRKQCYETQKGFIERVDLEQVFGSGQEALVRYVGHTKNGKSFRNVEYFRFKDDKIQELVCYFGEQNSFPSAVSAKG